MYADWILDGVAAWASPSMLLRELEGIDPSGASVGRLDGLIVPMEGDRRLGGNGFRFSARTLVGVEVKISRRDLARGLKDGQLERYQSAASGLILACPRAMRVQPRELPEGVGLLVYDPQRGVLCRRRVTIRDYTPPPEMLWRVIGATGLQAKADRRAMRVEQGRALKKIGSLAASRLRSLCRDALRE